MGPTQRKEEAELAPVVATHHKLDVLLLERAEAIFSRRVDEMRALKREGLACSLRRALGQPGGPPPPLGLDGAEQHECGLRCPDGGDALLKAR